MRPLIGITSDFGRNSLGQPQTRLNEAYSRALADAGAAPLVIPSDLDPDACAAFVAGLDGILLSGGGDIEPWRYEGDDGGPLVEVSPARDELELSAGQSGCGVAPPVPRHLPRLPGRECGARWYAV